jgi:mannose-6-phosphate isomerase
MTEPILYPFLFEPVYKDYLWGGGSIPRLFHRKPQAGACAESWEIADRVEGMSVVRNGPLAGRTLRELAATMQSRVIGSAAATSAMPLLIKIIDAGQRLSLQVHPDTAAAACWGGEPKTEMWYVLNAAPGAQVWAGLIGGVDEAALRRAIRDKRVEEVLRRIPVQTGDAIYVPGGRVHAIDAGCLLLEVQQSSNTTFRLHDWERVEADGRPRPLHLEEGLRVIRWRDDEPAKVVAREMPAPGRNRQWEILQCPYFRVVRMDLREAQTVASDGRAFQALFVAAGNVRVEAGGIIEALGPGTSCLVPAAVEACRLDPDAGPAQVLRATLG